MELPTEHESKRDPDCVFCSIVAGETESSQVYRDDSVIAFLTIGPVTEGHVLVCPVDHYPYLADLPDDVATEMFRVSREIAGAIRASSIRAEGINLFYADGEIAFQEVFHSHMHVFPRYEGDTFKLDADWTNQPPRSELDAVAETIRESLGK
jgi:histidine triad (HIT) family protein